MKQRDILLIVDDMPDNISVLFNFLTRANFEVLVAPNGKQALRVAEYARPDLILLDIMMPEMDGFEVCQALKNQPTTQHIPIIFMTALTNTGEKVRGFTLGAADYITKPIQHEEVLARINTHIKLNKLQRQLQEQNRQLQEEICYRREAESSLRSTAELLSQRTVELQEGNKELQKKNLELDAFAHMVAHDLKNPLNAVIGLTKLLASINENDRVNDQKQTEILSRIIRSSEKILSIINALLKLAGISKQIRIEIKPLNMTDIIEQVIQQRLTPLLDAHPKEIIKLPENWPIVKGYEPWVEEIWTNYLTNAFKYGGQPPQVTLGAEECWVGTKKMVRFWVRDNGPGLTLEEQKQLFTPFTRLHRERAEGHGLGLSIVQQIVEKLGGQAGVESEPGKGSLFYFTLPT
jgi:signal transduction histidine kinase